jgi:hypothetical protein
LSRFASVALALWLCSASIGLAEVPAPILWHDNDDLPIAEPAEDPEGNFIWWEGVRDMALYPIGKILDLGQLLHTVGEWTRVVGPREAVNVNVLDEVPDSSWFTNRHARRRLSAEELARGPNSGPPPAEDGPLVVISGKALGMTPGFVVRDIRGNRYVIKLDAAKYPELSSGAEIVCSKIVWALGWNVPDYHLFLFRPERLKIAPNASARDEYGRKIPLTPELLAKQLDYANRLPDGRYRSDASRWVRGTTKGSPDTLGVRADDPNDTVRHENRRELRGLRVVASLINYTDLRRGNLLDSFVRDSEDPASGGHLVHYVIDFNSALGAGNVDWKDPKLGNEYLFDPPKVLGRILTLGLVEPAWAKLPLTHPTLGYFESSIFDPESWKPSYLNPLFDHATVRDRFWGAKLVASLTNGDLRTIAHAGGWSDPDVEELLTRILIARRNRIARAYFDARRINPVDHFAVEGATLRFEDLAIASRIVTEASTRYRYRTPGADWTVAAAPRVPIADPRSASVIELETSHDLGARWSPITRIRLAPIEGALQVVRIERETR